MGDKLQMTAAEYQTLARGGKVNKKGRVVMDAPGAGKYGNQKQADPEGGGKIDSKLEARHRAEYRAMLAAGEILSYSHQPEFMLPGKVKYVADHMIVHMDMSIEVIDSKGMQTSDFRIKWKQVQELYPQFKWTLRK